MGPSSISLLQNFMHHLWLGVQPEPQDAPKKTQAKDPGADEAVTRLKALEKKSTPMPAKNFELENYVPANPVVNDELEVEEGLTVEEIAESVQQNLPKMVACFKSLDVPAGKIQLLLNLTVSPKGLVEEVEVESSLESETLTDCVAGIAKTIKFPEPKGGASVEVQYPFEVTIH